MIKFFGNIDDCWSSCLDNFIFSHRSNTGQRDYFHPNYSRPSNDLLQAFDNDIPKECSEKIFSSLKIKDGTISWTLIEPGNVIPVHTDMFHKLREKFNIDINEAVRYLIFLEDWTLGHCVEFEGQIITKWKKGDVWVFDHLSEHYAANASNFNFITCQVNTFIRKDTN